VPVIVLREDKQVSLTVIRGRIENLRSKAQFLQDNRDQTPAEFTSHTRERDRNEVAFL
jgi:hypothetical protein